MRTKIKRLHSSDVDNLRTICPSDKESFAFLLQVMVGVENKKGSEKY